MPNDLFRASVAELFEKMAWPHDANTVLTQVHPKSGIARNIRRGQKTVATAEALGRGAGRVGNLAGRAGSWLLRPAYTEGTAVAKELGSLLKAKPSTLLHGAAAMATLPIIGSALNAATTRRQQELMNLEADPSRGFEKMSLDAFLEKKAQARSHWSQKLTGEIAKNIVEGAAKGVGVFAVDRVADLFKKVHTSLIVDPKRRQLFESVVRSDTVIQDAVQRNPTAAKVLLEAFETMVRFAPSLTLDVNAVRSFLREAVVGGTSGVNYATIKSLIETEKAIHDRGGRK